MIYKVEAILNLRPNQDWVENDGIVNMVDGSQAPTEAEIQAEVQRLQAEYDANQYQRDRASEYPSIEDQLDTLYHGGIDAWKAEVKAVKDKLPKPGGN